MDNLVLISRASDDDRYEYDYLSSLMESEDDDETSDDDYLVDDDGVECEFSRGEESDSSSYDDDDDEREGCNKMVKERVRKLKLKLKGVEFGEGNMKRRNLVRRYRRSNGLVLMLIVLV